VPGGSDGHDRDMGEVRQLRPGRALFVDDRGHGLRATWHPIEGFVNLSLWRDDRCVETFRLSVDEAARLVDFLADGLTTAGGPPGASVGSP
jgi:hypothetical protein